MQCQVGAMLVLVNLDIFAQFLAAWHPSIEPHKLPESAHPKAPCLPWQLTRGIRNHYVLCGG